MTTATNTIWVLNVWDHREHYEQLSLHRSREGAEASLAEYCRSLWTDSLPDDDRSVIQVYFERAGSDEGYLLGEQEIEP